MYLIGTEKFDVDDDDWITIENFVPKDKYLDLFDTKLNNSKWEFVLDFCINLITDFIKKDKFKNSFLNKAKFITTGFDDGDLVQVK